MCFDDGHCLSVWLFVGVLFVGVGSQARTALPGDVSLACFEPDTITSIAGRSGGAESDDGTEGHRKSGWADGLPAVTCALMTCQCSVLCLAPCRFLVHLSIEILAPAMRQLHQQKRGGRQRP